MYFKYTLDSMIFNKSTHTNCFCITNSTLYYQQFLFFQSVQKLYDTRLNHSLIILNIHLFPTYPVNVSHLSDLIIVISLGQQLQTVGVEVPTAGVQLGPVFFCQLCSKRVDGNDESSSVCFKLQ